MLDKLARVQHQAYVLEAPLSAGGLFRCRPVKYPLMAPLPRSNCERGPAAATPCPIRSGRMSPIVDYLLALPAWLILLVVAVMPALEASTFIGLVFPGEIAVLAGGAAAHGGGLPLWAVMVAASLGAAVGDQVGYLVGRRYGNTLINRLPERVRRSGEVDRAMELVARRGALAVALGRWAAALRALVPGIAGMSSMGQIRFTVANIAGGSLWATVIALLGYFGAASLQTLESRLGFASELVTALVVVLIVVLVLRSRRTRHH